MLWQQMNMASINFYFAVLAILPFILEINADDTSSKLCKADDEECLTSAANEALKTVVKGNSTLGAEPLDPATVDKISGSMFGMDFEFSPAHVSGLTNCTITDLKLDLENARMHLAYFCPEVIIYGKYELDGVLLGVLPEEGKGEVTAPAKDYNIAVDANLIFINGPDGKTYLNIGHQYTLDMNLMGGVVFHMTGLFDGDEAKSKAALDFANRNWRLLTAQFQEPLFRPFLDKAIDQKNKYLNTIPLSDLVLQE